MANKYYNVNWIDGMKIQKQHFIDEQKASAQQVMQGVFAQLSAVRFGVLGPTSQHEEASYQIDTEVENTDTIQVKISRCRAATPGGFLIDIGDASGEPREFSIALPDEDRKSKDSASYLLVLTVSPFTYREVGEADPEETPPRRPYVEPEYQLGLLPKQSEDKRMKDFGRMALPIAEVKVTASGVNLDKQYIPPSMAVYSTKKLIAQHSEFYQSLRKLENLSLRIIRKIVTKQQEYVLALIVKQLSEDILRYLGSTLYHFNGPLRYEAPVKMVEHIASLGRLIRNSIDLHQGTGKEELINYFVEWCDLNQGELEKVITSVVDHDYNHTSISEAMETCSKFLEQIVGVYAKLDELDYIGRKAEKDIFVKEEKRKQKPKKKRINFLAQ